MTKWSKWSKAKRKAQRERSIRAWQSMSEEDKQRHRDHGKAQAAHGIEGGRAPLYPPCKLRANNKQQRHRFIQGCCRCSVVNVPNFYKHEEIDGVTVWYQRDGTGWKRI